MKKILFEFEIDDLQPEEEMDASDIYGMVYQRFPLSLISVHAVEQPLALDALYEIVERKISCQACGATNKIRVPIARK